MRSTKQSTGKIKSVGDKNAKIKQLQDELGNLKRLNASKIEIHKRLYGTEKMQEEARARELQETVKTLSTHMQQLEIENVEIEREISSKQNAVHDAQKRLENLRKSGLQSESRRSIISRAAEVQQLQAEFVALTEKKKELLEEKTAKEEEHKVLKEDLRDYLKDLQQKFLGYLFNGNIN